MVMLQHRRMFRYVWKHAADEYSMTITLGNLDLRTMVKIRKQVEGYVNVELLRCLPV